VSDVASLRRTLVFLAIVAVVTFGLLLFLGPGTMGDIEDDEGEESFDTESAIEDEVDVTESEVPETGEESEVSAAPLICENCRQANPAQAKFCFACGNPFSAAE
jgi:hypothetical protein